MLFHSLDFAIFLPIVFAIHWAIGDRHRRCRSGWLLAASYFFYGWWDWRFLSLIILSSGVDFFAARSMQATKRTGRRRIWLGLSLLVNLSMLGIFKYAGFFLDSIEGMFTFFGRPIQFGDYSIVLPAGISFYTFQTLGYTIDVYRGKIRAVDDPVTFFAFVSFFPQLVAGPIERAGDLVPQFFERRVFNESLARDGLRQMLWGLTLKCLVADNCGRFADVAFQTASTASPVTLWIGAIAFAFQIYGDFAGYSNIAIGVAKLFGFQLSRNFDLPYLARDPIDFWRRWHITLSRWFRDYIYIPMGGSRGTPLRTIVNLIVVFAVSGLWHGAAWTFVLWGLYHAAIVAGYGWFFGRRWRVHSSGNRLSAVLSVAITFGLVTIGWVIFRSPNLDAASTYFIGMIDVRRPLSFDYFPPRVTVLVVTLMGYEWIMRNRRHGLDLADRLPKLARWTIYHGLIAMIYAFGVTEQSFIYFQF